MSTDEMHGRMSALEVLSLTSLGLYLANAGNDSDMSKARAVLYHPEHTAAEIAALRLAFSRMGVDLNAADEPAMEDEP